MKIAAVQKLAGTEELIARRKPEHVKVTSDELGNLIALSWLYDTADTRLRTLVKKLGGMWDYGVGGWIFSEVSVAQEMLSTIITRHPDWPVIGLPNQPYLPLSAIPYSRISVRGGLDACLVPVPLPFFSRINMHCSSYRIGTGGTKPEEIGIMIGTPAEIDDVVGYMCQQGAVSDESLAAKWSFPIDGRKLRVKVNGWAIQVTCDLSDPIHYQLAPQTTYRWVGKYPDSSREAVPWSGLLNITRKSWPAYRDRFQAGRRQLG